MVDVRIGDEDGSGDSAYRFGPTRFSVIPRSAVGNVSIRFVPDQNADHLIAALRCGRQCCTVVQNASQITLCQHVLPYTMQTRLTDIFECMALWAKYCWACLKACTTLMYI